jgi:HD-GYP domain-containing protein (c-di-GMP phosphodiesterase class II)
MTKMNFQFHATKNEIIELVKKSLVSYNLYMVCVQLFPDFEFEIITVDEFEEKKNIICDSRMIFLRLDKPELTQKEYFKFLEDNQNSLVFSIGKQTDYILEESTISTMAVDPETIKLWKKIINGYKKTLLKGAWVVHSINGNMGFYKNHRYSPLSQKAFQERCKIVQFEQLWSYYILDHEVPE